MDSDGGVEMDAIIFKGMATEEFKHAPMSIWKAQNGFGGLRFFFFLFLFFRGGKNIRVRWQT